MRGFVLPLNSPKRAPVPSESGGSSLTELAACIIATSVDSHPLV